MSALPPPLRAAVDAALEARGHRPVRAARAVAGGSISRAVRVEGADGRAWFLKWHPTAAPGMFRAEVEGLGALADAVARATPGAVSSDPVGLRVPRPLAAGPDDAPGWLLMEYVEPTDPTDRWHERMGRGLALLHRVASGPDAVSGHAPWGWPSDNWIGSLPQANGPDRSWGRFWRDRRIVPQLEAARRAGHLQRPEPMDRLVDLVPRVLAEVESARPALLHGDLWRGNALADEDGRPVLVDPAVFRGHGEVDLAMTELFGGFAPAFYDAYAGVTAIPPEYRAFRRSLYQLYYLLVHVNLFGTAYEADALAAARTVVEAWT